MAECQSEFDIWLKQKLCSLNTDDEVYSPYIKGILECDDNIDEKKDALVGILSEIVEIDVAKIMKIENICAEFIEKFSESCIKEEEIAKLEQSSLIPIEDQLAKLLEDNNLKINVVKETTSENKEIKQAILAQYAQVSEDEIEDEEETKLPPSSSTNVEAVNKAERAKREQNKEASSKKKEKDKEERLKQKTKAEQRKEKEKKRTQKGEKRR